MENTKKPCLLIYLLLFLFVASTVHGVQVADAKNTGADGEGIAVAARVSFTGRKGAAGHGRGYSHRAGNKPNGQPEEGTPSGINPRNIAATTGHHHRCNAASRTVRCSTPAMCMLVGATLLLVLV